MKITNRKLLQKQILTVLLSIAIMFLIAVFSNYLKTYGLSRLFTTNLYKTAFSISQYDKFLIKIYATAAEFLTIAGCYIELSYNKDIAEIEREERLFMKGVRENG